MREGEPRTSASSFTQLRSCDSPVPVQRCFTSTETIRLIRDGEPRMATSTFTRLLGSETDRQTDRQTDRDRQTETDRQTGRERQRQTETETHRQTDRELYVAIRPQK